MCGPCQKRARANCPPLPSIYAAKRNPTEDGDASASESAQPGFRSVPGPTQPDRASRSTPAQTHRHPSGDRGVTRPRRHLLHPSPHPPPRADRNPAQCGETLAATLRMRIATALRRRCRLARRQGSPAPAAGRSGGRVDRLFIAREPPRWPVECSLVSLRCVRRFGQEAEALSSLANSRGSVRSKSESRLRGGKQLRPY